MLDLSAIDRTKLRLVDILRGTDALDYHARYQQSQWRSATDIQEQQWQGLKALLQHAYANVPYYRQVMTANDIYPDDIASMAQFRQLPFLTKAAVRANMYELLAGNQTEFQPHKKATGGSTGTPLTYYMDRRSWSSQWGNIYRLWGTAGWQPGDRVVFLGGTSLYPSSLAIKKWVYTHLNNWLLLSAFGMSDTRMQRWLPKIRRFKARYLHAYASSAFLLARFVERNEIHNVKFDAVFTTAEVLQPRYRETIERVFDCKVYDFYGAADGGAFAFECERQSGLHYAAESSILEVVDESGTPVKPGTSGELITTDLLNFAMPFIRYKVGDLATMSATACDCGRGLPLIRNVIGRTPDVIISKNGESYHEEFFSYLFKEVEWVSQFCVIQENRDTICFHLKTDTTPEQQELDRLRQFLSRKFAGMQLHLVCTDKIPINENGKFKYIINHASSNGEVSGN